MSQEYDTDPIVEAVNQGWQIVGVTEKNAGALLVESTAHVILAKGGNLRRVGIKPNKIPKWGTEEAALRNDE